MQDLPETLRARTMPLGELIDAQERGHAWVAVSEWGQIVGFLVAEELNDTLHVREMSVLPSHGRKGIGTAFLAEAGAFAREAGISRITLTTFRNVAWNAPFYKKAGFRVLAPEDCGPDLLARLEKDSEAGLKDRVVMCKDGV